MEAVAFYGDGSNLTGGLLLGSITSEKNHTGAADSAKLATNIQINGYYGGILQKHINLHW